MDRRSPVHRLALITVSTALVFAGLLVALMAVDPRSGASGLLVVLVMVAALAALGFA